MSLTQSKMMPLGSEAPNFQLPDTISNKTLTLSQIKGDKATLIMFICNHCPYVVHIEKAIVQLAKDFANQGLALIAISANDVNAYPQDSPEMMAQKARTLGFTFPYLYDETQETAKAYGAVCTPDLFLFDSHLKCVYRGQFDDARPGNGIPVTGQHIRLALNDLLSGRTVSVEQIPSVGCNIKWK